MSDKSWLLNPSAIAAAKVCIKATEDELGVKLKLSHPQFLAMLKEYAELTESETINTAFKALMAHAGDDVVMETVPATKKVIPIKEETATTAPVKAAAVNQGDDEMIHYKGKQYEKFREGKEFQGLYRGQPRYA